MAETNEAGLPKPGSLEEEKPIIKNLFEDMKERLSGPFISSFLISWIIANWKIIIALFWNSKDYLKENYNDSHIEFIEKTAGWRHSLILPLLGAFIFLGILI